MKKEMFNFIKQQYGGLLKILDIKLKDTDDENGLIGSAYEVKCLVKSCDIEQEQLCLVNKDEFQRYINQSETIKWI